MKKKFFCEKTSYGIWICVHISMTSCFLCFLLSSMIKVLWRIFNTIIPVDYSQPTCFKWLMSCGPFDEKWRSSSNIPCGRRKSNKSVQNKMQTSILILEPLKEHHFLSSTLLTWRKNKSATTKSIKVPPPTKCLTWPSSSLSISRKKFLLLSNFLDKKRDFYYYFFAFSP